MIRQLVQEGKLQEALNELQSLYESLQADSNTLAILNGRLGNVTKKELERTATANEIDLERNRITDAFLYFFENLEERVNTVLGLKYDVKDFDNQVRLKMMRQFDIKEAIGSGTSAVIYKARELSSGKTVAIRALKDIKPLSDKLTQVAYQIKHRNIIEILSSHESDLPFCIVLEYVNGITLDHLLEVGYFPMRDTISIIRQLCDALYYLQNLGIDHKNLRPSKIIIDHELKPVISVFEIFKDMRGYSRLDKIKDDLIYSSPEELILEPEQVDFDKVNQFLMGLLLYEMLTGDPLFKGENVRDLMENRRRFFEMPTHRRSVLRAANLPKGIQPILERLLQKDPTQRYSNLVELEKALYRLPIHGERKSEIVHESYLRCCAKNRDFISSFYARLFNDFPDKKYAERFGSTKVGNRTRKKLRVMILQLMDMEAGHDTAPISRIQAYNGHSGLAKEDFSNFLRALKAEIEVNDHLWHRVPDISEAWDAVIERALGGL